MNYAGVASAMARVVRRVTRTQKRKTPTPGDCTPSSNKNQFTSGIDKSDSNKNVAEISGELAKLLDNSKDVRNQSQEVKYEGVNTPSPVQESKS